MSGTVVTKKRTDVDQIILHLYSCPHNSVFKIFLFLQIKKVVEELEDRPELQHVVSITIIFFCPLDYIVGHITFQCWGENPAVNSSC